MTTRHPVLSLLPEENRLEIVRQARKNPWAIVAMAVFGGLWGIFLLFSDVGTESSETAEFLINGFIRYVVPAILTVIIGIWIERLTINRLVEEEIQRA